MTSTSLAGRLVKAIQASRRSAEFSASGVLDTDSLKWKDLGLEIDGIGGVNIPLRPKGVREILAAAEKAPYGKGTKTIIDQSVRNSLEIAASKIKLSATWNAAIESATRDVATQLGLPATRVQAKLYKLLIYQKGGFFLPHRDSEKQKNMVGSMIVILPSSFDGGELIVEHGESRRSFAFEQAANGNAAQYAAFYADCQHEVRRVTRGVRVCLAYNLVVKPQRKKSSASDSNADDALVAAITQWTRSRPRDPMVFALEHQYTSNGLKPDLLKGNDRAAAKQIIQAADKADCCVHFGQVSRHLLQFADDGSFGRGRHYRGSSNVDISDLDIGETYEDEVTIDGWKDARGKRVSMDSMNLDSSMLVSDVPLQDWKPTSSDYEGYTGNAGNTLDRWYHKSAVVLWPARHHFDILVRMGMRSSIEMFLDMRVGLSSLHEDDMEQACDDCEALARAIIDSWPERFYRYATVEREDQPWLAKFATELPKLEEAELVDSFLRVVALRDWCLKIDKLVLDSCRRFDADTVFPTLVAMLTVAPPANKYGRRSAQGLAARDADWVCKLACDRKQGGMTGEQIAELCGLAISRFTDDVQDKESSYYPRVGELDGRLKLLLLATLANEDQLAFGQLLNMRRKSSKLFDIRQFDVKACADLVKWADKRWDQRPAELERWLIEVRDFLGSATKDLPQPPRNFERSSETGCSCQYCQQLSKFLADSASETGVVKARKDRLEHVQQQIRLQQLDAKTEIDRKTRPFTLRLTKTIDSHHRAVKRYQGDRRLLESLPD